MSEILNKLLESRYGVLPVGELDRIVELEDYKWLEKIDEETLEVLAKFINRMTDEQFEEFVNDVSDR